MLNRIRQAIGNSLNKTVKTESSYGRKLRFSKPGGISQRGTPPSAAAAVPAPAAAPTDRMKWVRNGFLIVLGLGFVSRTLLNPNDPNSVINKILYPTKRGRWILKVERLDDKISNYQTAYVASAKGIPLAISQRARFQNLQKMGIQLNELPLSDNQIKEIIAQGKYFHEQAQALAEETEKASKDYIDTALTEAVSVMKKKEEELTKQLQQQQAQKGKEKEKGQEPAKKETVILSEKSTRAHQGLLRCIDAKIQLEMNFMANIEAILTKEQKTRLAYEKDPGVVARMKNKLLQLDHTKYEFLLEKISKLSMLPAFEKAKVFVLNFQGDVMASQVERMREEITAVLNICDAKRGDRVILQLSSGGGTVTGYGLAAAQLLRLKDAGLPLTVSVDEVAASGGYLMACVADEIVASPFAMLGSIGVVSTIPNFSERLEREGVVVEDVTAGKYKRTMTPYKKPTEEDRAKMKHDVEEILNLFKGFVKTNRPKLSIDELATGEVWLATDAKEKGLVDQLITADDLILQYYNKGYEVYALAMKQYIPKFGEENDPFSFSSAEDYHAESSFTGLAANYVKSFFYSVFSSVLKDLMHSSTNPFSMVNDPSQSYPRMSAGDVYSSQMSSLNSNNNTPIHHRILAVDPNQQNHPRI